MIELHKKRPLQDVDLYYIAPDGHVNLTNVRGGLAGVGCGSVAAAQAYVSTLYPEARPLATLKELNEIANQRCELYLSHPYDEESAFLTEMMGVLKELVIEDAVLAECVKKGFPISAGQRYLEKRWNS